MAKIKNRKIRMGKKIDYKKIFKLQDEVINIVFSIRNSFYLTVGNALQHFYFKYRFSDDLDFFADKDPLFNENVNEVLNTFEDNKLAYQLTVSSRDFNCIVVKNVLKVDFVNDYIYRVGKSKLFKNFRVDNLENILANKITEIYSRDEGKDVFDMFVIASNKKFNWSKIVDICRKKTTFNKEYLLKRLRIFSLDWLNKIKMLKNSKLIKNI